MKTNRPSLISRHRILGTSIGALLAAQALYAVPLYWDTNTGANAGSGSANGTWSTNSSLFSTDPNGSTAITPRTTTNADDIFFSAGTNGTGGTVTVAGTQAAHSLTFDDPVNITVSGGTALNLGDASAGSGIFFTANGTNTVSTAIILNAAASALTFRNSATTNQMISSTVTGAAAAGTQLLTLGTTSTGRLALTGVIGNSAAGGLVGLNVDGSGSGLVVLSATNTFTGGVTLTSGTLSVNAAGALSTTANTLTFAGGSIDSTATGAVTLSGNQAQNWNADFTFFGTRNLNLGTGAVTLSGSRVVTVNSNAAVAARSNATGVLTVGGAISGALTGLTKAGNGTLALASTSNSFTGGIKITGGALRLSGGGSGLNNNNVELNGGVLEFAYGPATTYTLGTGAGQFNFVGDGGFSASGGGRSVTLVGGTLVWGTTANFLGANAVLKLGGPQSDNALTLTNAIDLGGARRTIDAIRGTNAGIADGILSGAVTNGQLTKTGTGTLQLSNAATSLNGTTIISGGTLLFANQGTAIANTNIQLNGGVFGLPSGDFTAALGTGNGQVGFAGGTASGGFAAFNTNRTVNIGGTGATLIWDSTPDFLDTGALILGSSASGATTILANGLDFNGADRTIQVEEGGAVDDARIDGVITGAGGLIKTGGGVSAGGRLFLTADNTYTGTTVLRQGEILIDDSVLSGVAGSLGQASSAIVIGDASTLSGQDNNGTPLALYARAVNSLAGDSQNIVIDRGIDFSQAPTSVLPTPNVVTGLVLGRYRVGLLGNGGNGLDTSRLTLGGQLNFGSIPRAVEFYVERAGQVMNITGDIIGTGSSTLFLTGAVGSGPSVDGRTNGTFRFSNMARSFTSTVSVTFGTLIIEGSVAASGASPIGTSTVAFSDGNGGNILSGNGQDARRGLFLETPGAIYARGISPGGGSGFTPSTTAPIGGPFQSQLYGTGATNLMNGHRFGGLNTTGTVTYSGAIAAANVNVAVTGTAAGMGGTNVITTVHNFALIAETGGTVNFTGIISGSTLPTVPTNTAPGVTSAANNARVTINQFRNHPNLDENTNGVADTGLADALVGTATGGTVILSAVNSYGGTTEVLGGTLLVNGSITGTTATVASGATLGGSGSIFAGGAGSTLEINGTLSPGAAAAGTGNLTSAKTVNFNANSVFSLQLNSSVVGTGYDRLTVAPVASISLNATSTISLTLGYAPTNNDLLTLIDNQGTGQMGAFSNLADDSLVTLSFGGTDYQFFADYQGGSGNDLTLLAVPEPSAALSLLAGAGMLLGCARRRRRMASAR